MRNQILATFGATFLALGLLIALPSTVTSTPVTAQALGSDA
jgi:hypothetical protein